MEWLSTSVLLLVTALVAAALLQGASGFGFALVVAPVVGLIDPSLVPVVVLLWLLPLNSYVAVRERHAIDFRGTRWILAARLLGTPAGVAVLTIVTDRGAARLVGAMTLVAVVATLVAPVFQPGPIAYLGAGFVSGVGETATGVGGPPLALVYQHRPPPEIRSTVALCSLIGELVSLTALLLYGQVALRHLAMAALLLPAALAGAALSGTVGRRLGTRAMRTLALVFAIASSLVLLL